MGWMGVPGVVGKHQVAIDTWIDCHTKPCVGVTGVVKINEEDLQNLLRVYFDVVDMLIEVKKFKGIKK